MCRAAFFCRSYDIIKTACLVSVFYQLGLNLFILRGNIFSGSIISKIALCVGAVLPGFGIRV
jgi:hypothetical protein